MNNGFPGGFTPIGHNMALSCPPNSSGPLPVIERCIMHHTLTPTISTPSVVSFSQHINAVQNIHLNLPRLANNFHVDLNKHENNMTKIKSSLDNLILSIDSLSDNKKDLQKQLTQVNSLLNKALEEKNKADRYLAEKK